LKTKTITLLISPAIFNPEKCKTTRRGIGNIEYIRGIWLDFENGDLKPDEIPNLFPHTRMVVFNTFNHTTENPRFRVYIPTSDKMSPDVYTKIWDQIKLKLEDANYGTGTLKKGSKVKKSGLDKSKRAPCSLFYLPCQAKDPQESFFKDCKDGRMTLNPFDWVEHSAFDFDDTEFYSSEFQRKAREPDQIRIEAAKEEWRSTPEGMGNDAFFSFALELRKAGMSELDIEDTLIEEANCANSPGERRNQIPKHYEKLREKEMLRSGHRIEVTRDQRH
jgi:hypothetical protein